MNLDETEEEAVFQEDGILRFNAPCPLQYAHVPLEVWDKVFSFLADDVADMYRCVEACVRPSRSSLASASIMDPLKSSTFAILWQLTMSLFLHVRISDLPQSYGSL